MTRAEYEAEIAARVSQGVKVPFREVARDGWRPVPNDCHNNVDTWVRTNVGLTAVRGWMVESVGSLTAHSVVRDRDGQLFDITPFTDESLRLDFIKHQGDDATFNQMKATGVQIFCCAVDPEDLTKQITRMLAEWSDEQDEWPNGYD